MIRLITLAGAVAAMALSACGEAARPVVTEAGNACTTENAGSCASPTRLLVCTNQVWVIASDCKGPDRCRLTGDTYDCDLRGNSIGDYCPGSSEGKVRCEPDGGVHILRCVSGQLNSVYECQAPTSCGLSADAGLTCI